MRCPRCEADTPDGAKFCIECGAPLNLRCPQCGADVLPRAKFCGACGTPLGGPPAALSPAHAQPPVSYTPGHLAEKILTSKSALEGERKQVTVLFADLKGSMELLADRDPEEARQLLDPVLERMMAAVHRYEGTVNQVMGDGIMALFGAPIAHEDHAVRACYAALAMQEAIHRYSDEVRRKHGLEVQIRVGLNSGEVVVRTIGNDLHMDYSAIGQTTHLAARMEQLAPPGTIRLTAETLRLAEGWVQVTPLGPVPVKGMLEPIEVCELIGAGPARTRLQAFAARGLTPFVGRQAELEALHQALAQAETGHGQVVSVIGEPGVGKTRLFHEFTHTSRTHGWLRLESSSASYGKATPYLPIIDLLRAYFQIEDRDNGRRVREKLTGRLFTLEPALGPTVPAFLTLLDVPVEDASWQALDPPQRRQRTLEALKHVLLRESQVQPLLLVFENLHWIDAETQTLLDGLVESLPTARVVVDRFPEIAEIQPEWVAQHYTEAGLYAEALGYWQQAGQRANERSAHLEAISHLTKGLELLKRTPHTPEHTQHELTLQLALGVPLLAVKGFAAPEVEQAYARALCMQMGETPQLSSALSGLYGYYVARAEIQTARELAEQLLALAQRQHDLAHLLKAHGVMAGSATWLGAFAEARVHLEHEWALYDPQQHRTLTFLYGEDPGVVCLSHMAWVLWFLGYPDQALQRMHEALTLAGVLSHPLSHASALFWAARLHQSRREVQAAHALLEASIELASEQGFPYRLANVTMPRGWALVAQGQGEAGMTQIHQGLEVYRATGAAHGLSHQLALLAETYGNLGQPDKGLRTLAEALAAAHRSGERFYEAELHRLRGELLRQQTAPPEAVETCFHQALAVARRQQAKSLELRAAMSLSRLWQRQGKRDEAHALLAPVVGWFTEGFDTADLQEAQALLEELS